MGGHRVTTSVDSAVPVDGLAEPSAVPVVATPSVVALSVVPSAAVDSESSAAVVSEGSVTVDPGVDSASDVPGAGVVAASDVLSVVPGACVVAAIGAWLMRTNTSGGSENTKI